MRFPFRELRPHAPKQTIKAKVFSPIVSHGALSGILEQPANTDDSINSGTLVIYDDKTIQEIKAKAFAEGRASALQELDDVANLRAQEQIQALQQIIGILSDSAGNLRIAQEKMSDECIELALEIAKKLIGSIDPAIIGKHTIDFVKDIINKATPPAPVTIVVPEVIYSLMREACGTLIEQGDIEVWCDNTLSVTDCRIEWHGGLVERNYDKILSEISSILKR